MSEDLNIVQRLTVYNTLSNGPLIDRPILNAQPFRLDVNGLMLIQYTHKNVQERENTIYISVSNGNVVYADVRTYTTAPGNRDVYKTLMIPCVVGNTCTILWPESLGLGEEIAVSIAAILG